MKRLLLAALLTLSLPGFSRIYYTSPTGNDNNTGTITAPFKTLVKAWSVVAAGDTIYMRGGTHAYDHMQYLQSKNGTAGNHIRLWAYPGETPVITRSASYAVINGVDQDLIYCEGNYLHWKNLEIANFSQKPGETPYPAVRFGYTNNSIFENLKYHDNMAAFSIRGASSNNLILNSDFYRNQDPYGSDGAGTDAFDGADGLQMNFVSGTNNTIRGCRAWWNADDGFDIWENNGYVLFDSCWAFWNGYIPGTFNAAGNGSGIKLGQTASLRTTLLRTVQNCIVHRNRSFGVAENAADCRSNIYNNTVSQNGVYGFWFGAWNACVATFVNNISYNNTDDIAAHDVQTTNSWQNGRVVNSADFASTNDTELTSSRAANGSLPVINFLKLATGSDLINVGTGVGIPFNPSAPDLGAFEFGTTIPNQSPTANAGTNKNITLPTNTITQTGSGTDPDGSIAAYQWTKIAGPATFTIVSPTQATTVINNVIQGTYQFELRVTDNLGATARDTMTLTVNAAANIAPTANAGANQTITLPVNTVTVTGSGTDTDGSIATYQWTKIAGPATFTIVSPTQASTAINNLVQGTYQFELRVTDNLGAIGRDTMNVVVNAANSAPTANAGANQTITLPINTVTVTGTGTDTDGSIASYQWTKIAGPATFTIVASTQASTAINNLVQGTYQFELRVTDNLGAIGRDTMNVVVNAANIAPTANAGANQTLTLPASSVTLTGTGTDTDGSISAYAWTKISGPATFTIVSPATAQTVVNNLIQGTYVFRLTVTDNSGATADAFVTITVNSASNQAPTANAGADRSITLPVNTVTVNGSGTDPDGSISSYAWTKISGPVTFNIATPNQASTAINNLVQGIYIFSLTVTDNAGATGIDYITITVNAAGNQSPVANAGADRTISLPVNTLTVTGTGTDPDGSIAFWQWTKIAGPVTFNIVSPTQASTVINSLVQGVYQFELRVTDNLGAVARDTVTVTVNAAPNQAPIANAGADQIINLPTNTVSVTGSGTDADGSVATYQWTKIAGPATFNIVSPTQAQTTINTLIQGSYQFELRVTDNLGAIDRDTMNITVNPLPNQPPVANAGADLSITLPLNTVTLNGAATDADGSIITYQWTKISGPAAFTIASSSTPQTAVNGLAQGIYVFRLTVTDNNGASATDDVTVTVNPAPNQAPVASAGNDRNITLPINSLTVTGTGTDTDGSIASYQWTKIAGPATFSITSPTQAQTLISNLIQGTYQFELRVTDNLGAIGRDTMTVTVNIAPNQAPVAAAGIDRTITLPVNSLTLTGSGTDPDGSIASYQWTKIAGPATYTIVSPTQAQTVINNLVQGVYQFELRVTDNLGAIGRDTISVTVNPAANQLPTANAGPNQTITLPTNMVSVTGTGTDPDGTITAYQWTKISGPAAFILSPNQAQTVISNLVQGTYVFRLTVTDNSGATAEAFVTITVNSISNQSPSANAGNDQTITLPVNSVTVIGSGTDPDGSVAAYTWTKISGPATGVIVNAGQAQTDINSLTQGTYVFSLTVTDNAGATGVDYVTVTVIAAANLAPTANAGADQTITLPVNTVNLTGSANDPDGTIVSYLWTKISGPATFSINSPTQALTSITNLVQGVYVFRLTVTDNSGATADAFVTINVNIAPNQVPVANAGSDQTIILPVNTVSLSGSATDPDGSIVSYLWTKISGPATYTIVSPAQAQTVINNLVQGVYVFRLTATDNSGATADAFVTITVNAAPNLPPVASAGSDRIITLPTNSLTLAGSGSDNDGTIVAYQWNKISGPAQFVILTPTQAQTLVNNLVQGTYQFELRVTDNQGSTGRDTVTVIVNPAAPSNQPPVANAGNDLNITLPVNNVTLFGSGTDTDGLIAAYQWSKIAGPATFTIVTAAQAQTAINNLVQGTYQFELTVTDNLGASGKDTVTVTVNPAIAVNQAPTVTAGTDQSITLPVNTVNVLGSATDTDGTIASYQWTKIAGPASFTIVFPTQAQTTINNLMEGTYQFELRATDNQGAIGRDTVTIIVTGAPNLAPVANAGPDRSMTLPTNSITHTGGGTDADGTIASYLWTKIAGPARYTIVTPDQVQTLFSDLEEGVYQFELAVTDNRGAIDRDTILVTVKGSGSLLKQVYPNPAIDQINIKVNGANARTSLVMNIYDSRGVSVYYKVLPVGQSLLTETVELSKLSNGMYIIEVMADGANRSTMKFVKQ